jgi:hemolysin D
VATPRVELEFLPAALEVEATPPLPAARAMLWTIVACFSIALAWACIGEVDIVAVAHGRIVPSGRVKVIQPLETGTVQAILVSEGERVRSGEPLVELDGTVARADRRRLERERLSLELDRARLESLIEVMRADRDEHESGQSFEARLARIAPVPPDQRAIARARFAEDRSEYRAAAGALADEARQQEAERRAVRERVAQLDATVPLVAERAASLRTLTEQGLAPRAQWLEIEQARIEAHKERDVQANRAEALTAALSTIDQRRRQLQAQYEARWLHDLAEVEVGLAIADQEIVKAERRMDLQRLVAPVDGAVQELAVHTIGGVVTPAQALMRIVPDEDAIQIEAWIANKDVGFVHAGQAVEIKIETFPFTRYGTIDGELLGISADAVPDERRGLIYAAQVRLAQDTLRVDGRIVKLTAGMAASVEIKLGRRRLVEFLLAPLLRYRDEAARER